MAVSAIYNIPETGLNYYRKCRFNPFFLRNLCSEGEMIRESAAGKMQQLSQTKKYRVENDHSDGIISVGDRVSCLAEMDRV